LLDPPLYRKILATLGPAPAHGALKMEGNSSAPASISFASTFPTAITPRHAARIAAAREAEKSFGRPVAILADLQGPKLRIGDLPGGQVDAPHVIRASAGLAGCEFHRSRYHPDPASGNSSPHCNSASKLPDRRQAR